MQKSRGDGQFDGSKVRRGNLDEEEGDDIGNFNLIKFFNYF